MGNTLYMCQRQTAVDRDAVYTTTVIKGYQPEATFDQHVGFGGGSRKRSGGADEDSGLSEDDGAEHSMYELPEGVTAMSIRPPGPLAILTNPLYEQAIVQEAERAAIQLPERSVYDGSQGDQIDPAIDAGQAASAAAACLERIRAEAAASVSLRLEFPNEIPAAKPDPVQL